MKFLRFVLPFLFERNWITGKWELSASRLTLFLIVVCVVVISAIFAIMLQSPVEYSAV